MRTSLSTIVAVLAFACLADAASPITGRILRTDPKTGSLIVRVERQDGVADGNTLTIATDANTRVTIEPYPSSVMKLAANMRVVIRPFKDTATSISATVPRDLVGKISTVDANSLVVVDGPVAITVPMDGNTRVIVDGKRASRADLVADVFVKVVPGAGLATEVETKSPNTTSTVTGSLVAINKPGETFGVLPNTGPQVNLSVNAATRITVNGGAAKFINLTPGMDVQVKYKEGVAIEITAILASIRPGAGPLARPVPGPVPVPGPTPAPRPPAPQPR